MNVAWKDLRPFGGSQDRAFEELCCQLAEYEPVPAGARFTRKGTPDAGIECFWKLPNGQEWGWQAKFFTSLPLTSGQWAQADESVQTALKKHPNLSRYIVCLPIDRPDARRRGTRSFLDSWNKRVAKWKHWAGRAKMTVHFGYWGEYEIFERLSREEHRGRHSFWFDKEFLSERWFKDRLGEPIANAGPRYTADLNVEVPIASVFDGLGRTSAFCEMLKKAVGLVARRHRDLCNSRYSSSLTADTLCQLNAELTDIFGLGRAATEESFSALPLEAAIRASERCVKILDGPVQRLKDESDKQNSTDDHDRFGLVRHSLYELRRALWDLQELAQSDEAALANTPALLIVGSGGTGKTHLLCDVAEHRVERGLPTVLLLGQQFRNEEPWSQIINLLSASSDRDKFLGALEAAAQTQRARALIFIDALNEGEGSKLWPNHLAGLLEVVSHYPRIGIAVSVRSSYERLLIPATLIDAKKLIRTEHHGFVGREYEAVKAFFKHYGLQLPRTPLLVPEFQNPLFLKLLCEGLKNRKLTAVPSGLAGVSAIFGFYVDALDEKLSRELGLDPKAQTVVKAVNLLVDRLVQSGKRWIEREEAGQLLDALQPASNYPDSLLHRLVSEGLLAEDLFWSGNPETPKNVIRFSYERFTDHMVIRRLLDLHLPAVSGSSNDTAAMQAAFAPDGPLGSLLKDDASCWVNGGLVEALAIQLPERVGKELIELAPGCANFRFIHEAFVESVVWRDSKCFTDTTLRYINERIYRNRQAHDRFLDALLTLAPNADHPYNSLFLHKNLKKTDLAERDAWWSIWLSDQLGQQGAVDRLIDWAWSPDDKSHISDDAVKLAAIALAWFFTTSNRKLRDRATKAMVALLEKRLSVVCDVLRLFIDVNDPYVLERMLAVAYGCATRSLDKAALQTLATHVYKVVFEGGKPPVNLLSRDYARGLIECAMSREMGLEIDVDKARPPYGSDFPSDIPARGDLDAFGEWREGMPDEEWSRVWLYDSVMEHGDFARYIIGTNSNQPPWSRFRLADPLPASPTELYRNFVKALSQKQRRALNQYRKAVAPVPIDVPTAALTGSGSTAPKEHLSSLLDEVSLEHFNASVSHAEGVFTNLLTAEQRADFEANAKPYMQNPTAKSYNERFDLSIAQRWIFKRVLELGWTVDRFGQFDRRAGHGRVTDGAVERIGKKYQWIAFHEFLARLADNFRFIGDWSESEKKYEGPWQLRQVRDIDPSCLITGTKRERFPPYSKTWWCPAAYDHWRAEPDDKRWLRLRSDLPDVTKLLEVVRHRDASSWLVLEAVYQWHEPHGSDEDHTHHNPSRILSYYIKSFVVRTKDARRFLTWGLKQNFMERWMPEMQHTDYAFFGEAFWALSTADQSADGWIKPGHSDSPFALRATALDYSWTGECDKSVREAVRISMPAPWLWRAMKLDWRGHEGCFFDDKNQLVAFDPSVGEHGPGALVVAKEALRQFLDRRNLALAWTIIGEKLITSGFADSPGRLEVSGTCVMNRSGAVKGRLSVFRPVWFEHKQPSRGRAERHKKSG